MKNVIVSQNQIIQDGLGYLRNRKSDIKTFRYYAGRLIRILISESLNETDVEQYQVLTAFKKTAVKRIKSEFILLPILRAGIAMLESALELLPEAGVGFAGLVRDEKTALAREYYWKVPSIKGKTVLILDPMLATGGSILHVLKKLREINQTPKEIRIICVVAAPEGIEVIHKEFPEVRIYTASVDQGLNPKKFIVPGLGDFGDRFFKTEDMDKE